MLARHAAGRFVDQLKTQLSFIQVSSSWHQDPVGIQDAVFQNYVICIAKFLLCIYYMRKVLCMLHAWGGRPLASHQNGRASRQDGECVQAITQAHETCPALHPVASEGNAGSLVREQRHISR